MKPVLIFTVALVVILAGCKAPSPKRLIHNKEFDWTITIPANFDTLSPEQRARMQKKGTDAIEKTYDGKVENNAKTIFVFQNDQFNYFESNYQPFNTEKDGNYIEAFRSVNNVLYHTFEVQMPDAKLDSASSQETISGLTFQVFKISIGLPNKMTLEFLMYSRLFDKKEFTVNIMTLDKA